MESATLKSNVVLDAIKERRSIGQVTNDCPPKHLIEQILEAATWAPNHHKTEPWSFYVITGDARYRLGEKMYEIAKRKSEIGTKMSNSRLDRYKNSPLRAPILIYTVLNPSNNDKTPESEEFAAVCCAIQNMLLAAHSLKLGAIWRTGDIIYEPALKDFFNLNERQKILGLIYLGYPKKSDAYEKLRQSFREKTVWI